MSREQNFARGEHRAERAVTRVAGRRLEAVARASVHRDTDGLEHDAEIGGDGRTACRPVARIGMQPVIDVGGAHARTETDERREQHRGVDPPAERHEKARRGLGRRPLPQLHLAQQLAFDRAVPLRLVGVIGRLYVVLESDRGLVLMDQHAAHERILFEQMLDRLEAGGEADSQRLLLPETVELSVRDADFLRKQLPILARLGVGLGEFGERTFLLEGLPPFAKVPDARRFVLELVDALKSAGEGVNALRLGEDVITKTVCRHAVKANDPLAGPELENLVADLRRCRMPYTCPHGRPTLIEMSLKELEKKFGRVQ